MEIKQEGSACSMPLEESLTDLILKPKSNKIRRPPNAFMLFARDHRKDIAKRNPGVSNKVVSSMLGQMWKASPLPIKQKYYKESQVLDDLHKRQYPDYIYSPREARFQKKMRKMKKDTMKKIDFDAIPKKEKIKEEKIKEENAVTMSKDASNDQVCHAKYVPNNPDYFIPQSSEINVESEPDLEPYNQCSTSSAFEHGQTNEMSMDKDQQGWSTTPASCECCQRDKIESKDWRIHPFEKERGAIPRFPGPLRYAAPTPFYNASGHFPRFMNYCGLPSYSSPMRTSYGQPFHHYWRPPMMNPHCFQAGDNVYDEMKSYTYPAHYPISHFYKTPFGYFDRVATPHTTGPSSAYYPYMNENWDHFRSRNEFRTDNPEFTPGRSAPMEQNFSTSYASNSESGQGTDNPEFTPGRSATMEQNFSTSYASNSESGQGTDPYGQNHRPCSKKLEPAPQEMANSCSSVLVDDVHSLNKLQSQYGWKLQEHNFMRDIENKRLELPSNEHKSENLNLSDFNQDFEKEKDKNLVDSHKDKESAESENLTISDLSSIKKEPQSTDRNEYIANREDTSQGPDSKIDITPPASTKPYIKTSTGINPIFTTNEFREICCRSPQLTSRNSFGNRILDVQIDRPTVITNKMSVIDASFRNKDFITGNQNVHVEQKYVLYNRMSVLENKYFEAFSAPNLENTQKDKTDDTKNISLSQFCKPDMNVENRSFDDFPRTVPFDMNRSTYLTEAANMKNKQNTLCKTNIPGKEASNCASTNQIEINVGGDNTKYMEHNYDPYYKILNEKFKTAEHFADNAEKIKENEKLRSVKQQEMLKIYCVQSRVKPRAGEEKLPGIKTEESKE